MTDELTGDVVRDLADLAPGDMIEAFHDGRCHNRGKVLQTVPSMAMFWVLDSGSGTRKLVDFETLVIRRISKQETRWEPSVG